MYNRCTTIAGKRVNGMPDVRFETHPQPAHMRPKLLLVTEVIK